MKTKILLLIIGLLNAGNYVMAQSRNMSFVIPEGAQYSVISNEDNASRLIFFHPDGGVWLTHDNVLNNGESAIELPSRIKPGSACWTNAGKLILFYNDTIYTQDNSQTLHPLAIIEAKNVLIQPYGDYDIVFCAVGDTIIYRYGMKVKTISTLLTLSDPIADIVVDDKDVFVAANNRVLAYTREKQYIPVFQNTIPIWSIAFCGTGAILFSDKEGLWLVDSDRNKSSIANHPIVDIVTDNRGLGFFKTVDGGWLFVSQINDYSK